MFDNKTRSSNFPIEYSNVMEYKTPEMLRSPMIELSLLSSQSKQVLVEPEIKRIDGGKDITLSKRNYIEYSSDKVPPYPKIGNANMID